MSEARALICRDCGSRAPREAKLGDLCPTDQRAYLPQAIASQIATHPLLGCVIAGRYAIIGFVGSGGFGAVYRAIDRQLDRSVALKVIVGEQARREQLGRRFFHEAKVVASLSNPAAVTLHDYGREGDSLYMVFEYIRGRELRAVIAQEAPMAPERVVWLAEQVLDVLADAHALGLIHRDLKPDNVMVITNRFGDEKVKVLDFGIAKLLETETAESPGLLSTHGLVLGTPAYISPEQLQSQPLGPPTDLYSFGIMLYEMLCGHRPFRGTEAQLVAAHLRDAPPPFDPALEIPADLQRVVLKALEKDPARRFPDARSMLVALRSSVPTLSARMRQLASAPRPVSPDARQTAPLPLIPSERAEGSTRQLEDMPSIAPTELLPVVGQGPEDPLDPGPQGITTIYRPRRRAQPPAPISRPISRPMSSELRGELGPAAPHARGARWWLVVLAAGALILAVSILLDNEPAPSHRRAAWASEDASRPPAEAPDVSPAAVAIATDAALPDAGDASAPTDAAVRASAGSAHGGGRR